MNELPLKLHKPGTEWLVELVGRVDGDVAVCGLFHSTDEAAAKSFYDNACRIISCWYVEHVWRGEGFRVRCLENNTEVGQCELREGHPGKHLAGYLMW